MKNLNTVADAAGAILLRAGVLGPQSLAAAATLKERDGGTLGEALVRLGLVDEGRLVAVFQQSLLVPVVATADLAHIPAEVLSAVPAEMASRCRVVPTEIDSEGNLTVAMADPTDNRAVDEIAAHTGRFVIRAVAAPSAVRDALFTHYHVTLVRTPLTDPPRTPSGERRRQASGPRLRDPLPPSTQAVPAAAVPAQTPGSMLQALARAVTPAPISAADAAKTARRSKMPTDPGLAVAKGRAPRVSKPPRGKPAGAVPTKVDTAGPILLDKPVRTPHPPGTTLPGLGSPAEELLAPVARLRAAQGRDEVIAVLLDYASLLAARVGLFVVQKGQLVCLDGRGPDHVVLAMKWFTIPVDDASPFRDVLKSRAPYIGTLADSAESRAFRNALGSTSGDLLLLPLIVGDRAVGVLYADEIRTDLGKLSVELQTLSREAGAAFARIILSRKSAPSARR